MFSRVRSASPTKRRTQVLAAVVVATVAAIAVVALHPWRSDATAGHRQPASVRSLNLPGGPQPRLTPSAAPAVRLPADADTSATAAVASFLRARSDGDAASSFALLAPDARRTYATQAQWVDALADLPAPATFQVTGTRAAGDATEVSVDVRRTPALNSFAGFVPARAVEVYRTVRSGGAWRVDPSPVGVTAILISDRTAAAAVTAWLDRVAACDGPGAAALQVSADLIGDDSIPGAICAKHARLRAAPARPMQGGPETAPFLSAYGPEIGSWARLVPVTGADQRLLVGVAPLGQSWRVFGIVPGGLG